MTTTSIPKESTFFRLLDIHVSEIKKYPSALQDIMFNRRFEGMIIREVFPVNVMEQVVSRLEKDEGGISSIFFPSRKRLTNEKISVSKGPHSFGSAVALSKPETMKEYFANASVFRQACRTLFQGNLDYEERLTSVFHSLSGELSVKSPTEPEGQTYSPSTIRVLPDGHEIGLHVDRMMDLPSGSYLKSLFDVTGELSFFIPLSTSEAGGELIVYAKEWDDKHRERNQNVDMQELFLRFQNTSIHEYESIALAPGVGDMVLFDGSRFYHRVTQASGSRPRRTIGGFLNLSREHDTVYYWV